ncbi:MAG: hypothetical protein M1449_07275 [Candidatus Thermoplasmatota archaeon]|nr:hypothetical protein [Candidatus Thermoplasmatota archaeon]
MKGRLAAAGVVAALMLAACQPAPQPPSFQATDITGAAFARDFRLSNTHLIHMGI